MHVTLTFPVHEDKNVGEEKEKMTGKHFIHIKMVYSVYFGGLCERAGARGRDIHMCEKWITKLS